MQRQDGYNGQCVVGSTRNVFGKQSSLDHCSGSSVARPSVARDILHDGTTTPTKEKMHSLSDLDSRITFYLNFTNINMMWKTSL